MMGLLSNINGFRHRVASQFCFFIDATAHHRLMDQSWACTLWGLPLT
ncbi:hypothetical protein N7453_009822 [Penicillium expansum]|nr:hypothetical protein N7453_009822 [Penicillium expansum]